MRLYNTNLESYNVDKLKDLDNFIQLIVLRLIENDVRRLTVSINLIPKRFSIQTTMLNLEISRDSVSSEYEEKLLNSLFNLFNKKIGLLIKEKRRNDYESWNPPISNSTVLLVEKSRYEEILNTWREHLNISTREDILQQISLYRDFDIQRTLLILFSEHDDVVSKLLSIFLKLNKLVDGDEYDFFKTYAYITTSYSLIVNTPVDSINDFLDYCIELLDSGCSIEDFIRIIKVVNNFCYNS